MCPKGDDPVTAIGGYRTITITTSAASGSFGGYFRFSFNGESFNFPANPSHWMQFDCEKSFAGLSNVELVSCSNPTVIGSHYAQYTVSFIKFPVLPRETNIFLNDGNPPLSAFVCDTFSVTGVVSPSCTLQDVNAVDIPGN